MQRAISKSQWLFRGTRSAPWVTHTKTGAERATSGPAQGGNEQLRASVVFFLKISLPLLRAAQVLIQQGCSPCMTRGATALWAPSQGGISFISDSILSSSFKPFPFTVTVCCGAAAPALEGAWSQWEPEVLQLCRGSLKFVHSKGCSVWNFFSECGSQKGEQTKQRNLPSHCLPSCKGLFWAGLALGLLCNKRIGQSLVLLTVLVWWSLFSAPGSPQPKKPCGTLSRDLAHGRGRVSRGYLCLGPRTVRRGGRLLEQSKRICRDREP